jgi:hypothetical protein
MSYKSVNHKLLSKKLMVKMWANWGINNRFTRNTLQVER